jgi:hypothetical protein
VKVAQLREHARELGFTPQDQVRWLAPVELARTALQVALASAFSTFTDKRELQRSFPADTIALPADDAGDTWFDFVADIGDGFDATYTIALALAGEQARGRRRPGRRPPRPPRGRLLILGGDEVYPTASSARYEDRMKGPYRTALSAVEAQSEPPLMLSLPGNHDWYDGLTAFLRVFGQRAASAAGRRAAAQLLRREAAAQLVAGRASTASSAPRSTTPSSTLPLPAHREPAAGRRRHPLLRLAGLGAHAVRPGGVRLAALLRAHDRAAAPRPGRRRRRRHRRPGAAVADRRPPPLRPVRGGATPGVKPGAPRQLVTCGLGGAYLGFTHRLPEHVELPPRASTVARPGEPADYRLADRYPDAPTSRRLVRGLFAGRRAGCRSATPASGGSPAASTAFLFADPAVAARA